MFKNAEPRCLTNQDGVRDFTLYDVRLCGAHTQRLVLRLPLLVAHFLAIVSTTATFNQYLRLMYTLTRDMLRHLIIFSHSCFNNRANGIDDEASILSSCFLHGVCVCIYKKRAIARNRQAACAGFRASGFWSMACHLMLREYNKSIKLLYA